MSVLINRCCALRSPCLSRYVSVAHTMSDAGRASGFRELPPLPPPPPPPHAAGCGSGWSNLLLPVCRCSDSQRALPWKLGHTDYMFWPVLMSVMQTEKLEEVKRRKRRRSSLFFFFSILSRTRFVSSLTAVYVRRLETPNRNILTQHFLFFWKIFTEARVGRLLLLTWTRRCLFLVNYKHNKN